MHTICGHIQRFALAFFLSACLVCTGITLAFPPRAWGDLTADEAQAALSAAEMQMSSILSEYDRIKAESDELHTRIAEITAQALEVQQLIFAGRQELGELAKFEYRLGPVSIWMMLLDAKDFREFQQSLAYLETVQQHRAQVLQTQRMRANEYEDLLTQLNKQQDEQDKKLAALEEKRVAAQQVVWAAQDQLQDVVGFDSARLDALAQQASGLEQTGEEPEVSEEWNTNPGSADDESNGGATGEYAEPSAGWSTGIASAYGGSSDPYTPNPGTTATGDICDDWSMGVAIPMSWPNYRSYFGRTVQIQYDGMTVLATVNDCGYMSGGGRSLDLQPGVFKAFGYGDCYAWGVREVSYRFL